MGVTQPISFKEKHMGFEFSADFVGDNWKGYIFGPDWTTALVQNVQRLTKRRPKHITVGEKIISF